MPAATAAEHGGTDGGPAIRVDFSTNAHPLGPDPAVRRAVERADRCRYPDPGYTRLRETLGAWHGVHPQRIVIGAGASELIWRLTRCWTRQPETAVATDERTFGEYLRAARALDATVVSPAAAVATPLVTLHWLCNPDNPSGASNDAQIEDTLVRTKPSAQRHLIVTDLAYWPFRSMMAGAPAATVLATAWAEHVVQLWSPNKLHGLTGVRAAYLVLPAVPHPGADADALRLMTPSWVLGADGVALLEAHVSATAGGFLTEAAATLRAWKRHQDQMLCEAGWRPQPSPLHYGLWQPPVEPQAQRGWHARLRARGIKLRDAASFARPGWVRLVTRSPGEVAELLEVTAQCESSP